MKLKVIKVRLPYKLDGKKSKTSIMIYVEFSDVERCLYWSLRLTGD